MNNWLSLVLAAVLGTVSAVALNGWKNAQEEALRKEYVTRPILVTEHSIKAGTVLTPSTVNKFLVEKQIPVKYIVAGMMTMNDVDRYRNYVITHRINADAPLLSQFLEPNLAQNATDDSVVLEGFRAVTVPVDQVGGVAGLLRAGDRVDVVGTFDVATAAALSSPTPTAPAVPAGIPAPRPAPVALPAATGRSSEMHRVTIPLLEAARVIALDNLTRADKTSFGERMYRSVTLEVTPYDALRLLNAIEQGKVQFLLRNRIEVDREFTGGGPVGVDLKQFELQRLTPHTKLAPAESPKADAPKTEAPR